MLPTVTAFILRIVAMGAANTVAGDNNHRNGAQFVRGSSPGSRLAKTEQCSMPSVKLMKTK
jgi:hypothetical protein